MYKKLFYFFLLIPLSALSQNKKTFYKDGVLRGDSIFDNSGKLSILRYYHKNGNLQFEVFYEKSGALSDFYALNETGDTTLQSGIPILKKQPIKDLDFIQWQETDFNGLFYAVEIPSKGKLIKDGSQLKLNYIGYFDDGSQFDNTYLTNKPLTLIIGENDFLPSFNESLKMFRQGEKGYIKISPELGYGDTPYGNIPPNSILIYYVDLSID